MASLGFKKAVSNVSSGPSSTEGVPMSTTKALMVVIVVPRIHQVFVAMSEEEDVPTLKQHQQEAEIITSKSSDDDHEVSMLGEPLKEVSDSDKDKEGSSPAEEKDEELVGYVTGEDPIEPVEHVVTAEEMAAVVKLPAEKPAQLKRSSSLLKEAEFFGIMNRDREDSETVWMNQEEAAAALKKDSEDKEETPNTEINVEALIELTFKALMSEGHLINFPVTFTCVHSDKKTNEEWIQVTVMIRDPSIGITLERLERIGVGLNVGTISIYRSELCRTALETAKPQPQDANPGAPARSRTNSVADDKATASAANKDSTESEESKAAALEAARAEWMNAASRLRVEQVKEQIAEQASFSFDFLSLLGIASILAGIGLIVDNTVVIVASMLVSPIMGPVMGITFGSRVRDWSLTKSSLVVECLALLLSVGIGALISLGSAWTDVAETWPTSEMSNRGETSGLLTGIAVAIPSGMGVALSILGNNTSSLVGVAISASLLPPAVNAGVCWVFAILLRTGAVTRTNDADFAQIGSISFGLTVINIVCIWLAGMFMFAIKEVAPTKTKSAFWKRDIKLARKVNTGSFKQDVDLEVLRAGLTTALEEEQREKDPNAKKDAAGPMRWKRPMTRASKAQTNVTFNLKANPVPESRVDKRHAEEMGLDQLVGPYPEGSPKKEDESDSMRYVRLEDMASLLGCDEEPEEQKEDGEQSNRWGWGWFG